MNDTVLLLILIVVLIVLVLKDSSPKIITREAPKTIYGYRCESCKLKVESETLHATCWDCNNIMTVVYIRTKV